MICPKCGSTNTRKPSVRDPQWRCGQQWCDDCGYRDDWVRFARDVPPDVADKAVAAGDVIRAWFEEP
jgi:hypothetical protein